MALQDLILLTLPNMKFLLSDKIFMSYLNHFGRCEIVNQRKPLLINPKQRSAMIFQWVTILVPHSNAILVL